MFKFLYKLFKGMSEREWQEEQRVLEAINKLFEEYDVIISSKGGLSKTSKPEFAAKHRKELNDAFPEIREQIKKYGFCKIKG